jgi:hypothetical protein
VRRWDYERELPYWEGSDGLRYQLGSAGSFILACPTCGEEHFREIPRPEWERCFTCHGPMELLTVERSESHYHALWLAQGDRLTTVFERRMLRLEREALFASNIGRLKRWEPCDG